MNQKIPVVLTLSGHDPSGGAGIQADIETLRALCCHACSVITALTNQDTRNVIDIYPQDPKQIICQIDTIFNDFRVDVIKIGLIGNAEVASALHDFLIQYPMIPVILDPVLAAGGGSPLADSRLIQVIKKRLLPLTTILTPNSKEARILASGRKDLDSCGRSLLAKGCQNVLITGTHENEPTVINRLYYSSGKMKSFHWPRLPYNYHGSGCTLAASIAAYTGLGFDPLSAIKKAQDYTWKTLETGYKPGIGQYIPNRLPATL